MRCNNYYNQWDLSALTRDRDNQSEMWLNGTRSGRMLSAQLG